MRQLLAMSGLGVLALVIQSALATVVPPPYCPDLGLLVVVSIGLRWRGLTAGLCLAAFLGFAADIMSGTLMGQHALLRMIAFASAFYAGRQLNLKGSIPLALFAGGVSLVYGAMLFVLSNFFVGARVPLLSVFGGLIQHAVINGVVSLYVMALVDRLAFLAGDDEALARSLHIDPRRRSA